MSIMILINKAGALILGFIMGYLMVILIKRLKRFITSAFKTDLKPNYDKLAINCGLFDDIQ